MTIEKYVTEWLFEQGLWEDECVAIISYCKKESGGMNAIRWSDNKDGYPEQFYKALLYSVKQFAISWLKENKPQHFALFMLEG